MASGVVYIGANTRRGIAGETNPTIQGVVNIDATSGSMNKIDNLPAKNAFSPMYLGPFYYGNQYIEVFENFWQYGKIFPELGHLDEEGNVTEKWREFRRKGWIKKRGDRHPDGTRTNDVKFVDDKGRNRYRYMIASSSSYDVKGKKQLNYIDSRKFVYCYVYSELVKRQPAFQALRRKVEAGESFQILDLDGPRKERTLKVTLEMLREKINDPSEPFGHGYVLAGMLAGIDPKEYCDY